jgi:DNA replication protein DnaC
MSAAQLERLQEHMQRLRLFKSRDRLEALLQEATAKEASFADFLDTVLGEEVAAKTAKHVTMRTQLARFPFVKSLEAFDFSYQPSLDKKQMQTLASCHFIEHGENLVLLGPPGVGKSHLAVGLGLKAIERGYRVLFTTAAALIAALTKAAAEGRVRSGSSTTACRAYSSLMRSGTCPSIARARTSSSSSSVGGTNGGP